MFAKIKDWGKIKPYGRNESIWTGYLNTVFVCDCDQFSF